MKILFLFLYFLINSIYAQSYIGETIFDEKKEESSKPNFNKNTNPVNNYEFFYRFGEAYNNEKLKTSDFGVQKNINQYFSGLHIQKLKATNYQIKNTGIIFGYQIKDFANINPRFGFTFGLSNLTNSNKIKGNYLGGEFGLTIFDYKIFNINTGYNYKKYFYEKKLDEHNNESNIFLGINIKF